MSNNPLTITPRSTPDAVMRLICFPYAGGSASSYISWASKLTQQIELMAVQLPGRASRILETPHQSMNEVVTELIGSADLFTEKPYVLFGHSLGSRVAFEVASDLQRLGYRAPSHFIASASRAPHLPGEELRWHELSDSEFISKIKQLGGANQEVLENKELLDFLMPVLRADFKISENHVAEKTILNCPITVLNGEYDQHVPIEDLLSWKDLTDHQFVTKTITGDHFFVDSEKMTVIDTVNTILQNAISRF